MTVILRRRFKDVYVVAEQREDGSWSVEVSDAASGPVGDEERKEALESVLKELSSLRSHVWRELGHKD